MTAPVRSCLWMEARAEEAARFYVSLWPDAEMQAIVRPRAGVALINFSLRGAPFQILEAAPRPQPFTHATSISVLTQDQTETDRLWAALTEGGEEIACGWLRDRFGVSWQIAPRAFVELLSSSDGAAIARAMAVMETMKKLELEPLLKAFRGA